jgi:fermentation-respiration switch protein FrsA (DUF1100 family)
MDRARIRRGCLVSILIVSIVALILAGGTGALAYLTLHPFTRTTGDSPSDPPALIYEEVRLTTQDGLGLKGWYVPGEHGATVIFLHGFARDRSELLPEARWLVERGYGALLIDLRAQGESDGAFISLGYLEAMDVTAAVDFVLDRSPHERIGVTGYSMGGVAGIQAAAVDRRIQAVLAVSPFATLRDTVMYRLGRMRIVAPLVVWWGERMTGLRLDALRPVDGIMHIAPRPVFIMQAGADRMVPLDSGDQLYQAAKDPKALWAVPGVDHVDFRQAVPEQYRRRVLEFFERYLPVDR